MECKVYVDENNVEDNKEMGKKSKKKTEIKKKEVNVTIAKNFLCQAELVIEGRGLDKEKVSCRVVIDGGQGSVKVCVSIVDRDSPP